MVSHNQLVFFILSFLPWCYLVLFFFFRWNTWCYFQISVLHALTRQLWSSFCLCLLMIFWRKFSNHPRLWMYWVYAMSDFIYGLLFWSETLSMKGLTLNCMDRKSEAYELVRLGLKVACFLNILMVFTVFNSCTLL